MCGRMSDELLPEPLVVSCDPSALEELLAKEWLLTNRIGAYASATVVGANTRQYHGLLVAAARPPVGRFMALSSVLDELVLPAERTESNYDLATFEFDGAFQPFGVANLLEFRDDVAATFVYQCGPARLVKEIILADVANAVGIRYRLLSGPAGMLRIRPFVALRPQHELRRMQQDHHITYLYYRDGIRVEQRNASTHALHLTLVPAARRRFCPDPQWWYRFCYRADRARGLTGSEDLYSPGRFEVPLSPDSPVQLTASLDDPIEVNFDALAERKRQRRRALVSAVGAGADELTRRLAAATDAFVVQRKRPNAHPAATILAGYHWFGDWGRDAMIALPGLLLETGRYETALAVLRGFAEAVDAGMVPNFFDEYGSGPSFNSIDASLWFIIAADRYVSATGDEAGWRNHLMGAVGSILRHYHDGARFGIHADADGLLAGGDEATQLTWMDACAAGRPVTPRHGKCVEINALWHAALRIAQRRDTEPATALDWGHLADLVAGAFERNFWNEQAQCLYDVVRGDFRESAIRPNQILAVALPDCPLPADKQRSVVAVVQRELLTPFGLRTLSPGDQRYRGHGGHSTESRDLAYHQGTVWPWLLGPFVEAYLKVNDFSDEARAQAGQWLAPFEGHLREAGLGYISETFDGDPPHSPTGCIAQAWSVGEILRAKRLVSAGRPG